MFDRFLNWVAIKAPAYRSLYSAYIRQKAITAHYDAALHGVWDATAAVTSPNGTTKKIRRLVEAAYDTVPA